MSFTIIYDVEQANTSGVITHPLDVLVSLGVKYWVIAQGQKPGTLEIEVTGTFRHLPPFITITDEENFFLH